MWAGGRVVQRKPLRCGEEATRSSAVLDQKDKAGRTGPMTVVTLGHEISQGGRVVIAEEQHLVYREAGGSTTSAGPDEPVRGGETRLELDVDPTLLFRFSALTYNAHRIHYDRRYAVDVEGYPGLVVHGPLQALAMAEASRRMHGPPRVPVSFDYRLVAPLYDGEGLVASAVEGDAGAVLTRVTDRDGRTTARGTLTRRQVPSTSVMAGPPEGPVSPGSTRRTTTRVPTTWGPSRWAREESGTTRD
jgi:3-methylfumaryl-CoA hydratase